MAKKKKKPQPTKFSPKSYLRERGRALPLYKCWVNEDWEDEMMANVIVSRKHVNGNFTCGVYLVDIMDRGLKESFAMVNEPKSSLDNMLEGYGGDFEEISYDLAHNIVYGGKVFSEDQGYRGDKDFEWTKYVLEEDFDNIPYIEIPFGLEDDDWDESNVEKNTEFILSMIDLVYDTVFGQSWQNNDFAEARMVAASERTFVNEENLEKADKELSIMKPFLLEFQDMMEENFSDGKRLLEFKDEIFTAIDSYPDVPQFYDLLSDIYSQLGEEEKELEIIIDMISKFPDDYKVKLYSCFRLLKMHKIDEAEAILDGAMDLEEFESDKNPMTEFEAGLFYAVRCKSFMEIGDFEKGEIYYFLLREIQMNNEVTLSIMQMVVLMEYGDYKREKLEKKFGKPFNEIMEEKEIADKIQKMGAI